MFLRIKFSADAEGNQRFEYGGFASLELLNTWYDLKHPFERADWSCSFSSFFEVGEPYQLWFKAMVKHKFPKCNTEGLVWFFDEHNLLPRDWVLVADIFN